jgi:uncharacterized cupredoxin-like copper-binding protein
VIRLGFLAALLFSLPALAQHSHGAHSHETAFGRPAGSAKPTRTVRVAMTDNMRFTPAEIRVKRGEIVRFVATNKGKVPHEIVLGTMDELQKHAEKMRSQPQMEHHDEEHGAEVAAGKSGSFAWQFTKPGEFYYACLIPGHFEAGMVGKVTVSP